MKSLKKIAINRAIMLSIISIAIILFSISSIDKAKRKVVFEVVESKVSISGTESSEKWKVEAKSITCFGSFEAKNHELLTISGLSFTLPINKLRSDNHQLESTIHEIFMKNNLNELIFKQQYSMILPIMKKIHVIGELNMLNGGTYTIPLQTDYELSNDQLLRIKGKQIISLKQYGIKLPESMVGIIDDEIELEIDFLLENKSI
jgi:hypothetical protein